MHERGIAWRDIKPDNLVYADQSAEKIAAIDFGFAYRFGTGTSFPSISSQDSPCTASIAAVSKLASVHLPLSQHSLCGYVLYRLSLHKISCTLYSACYSVHVPVGLQ